jgi:chromosomal replication initiation ATPase DnaA
MASPVPGEQTLSVQVGQKRKREDDESDEDPDIKDVDVKDESSAKMDTNDLIPDDYELDEDDGEDQLEEFDDGGASAGDDNSNHPTHDESQEPFPLYAIYDGEIENIEEKLTSIPQRIIDLLYDSQSSSKAIKGLNSRAEALAEVPKTEKIRIAILGGAGVGKSSLLNAITGKTDLAKSVSNRPMSIF